MDFQTDLKVEIDPNNEKNDLFNAVFKVNKVNP